MKISKSKIREIRRSLLRLFSTAAKNEHFEDGIETQFSKDLMQIVQKEKQPAIDILRDLIPIGKLSIEVGSEALRWIGRMDDPETHEGRRRLLEVCLISRFARIRDGALLGLCSMNDKESIDALRFAFKYEEIKELKEDMQQAILDFELELA